MEFGRCLRDEWLLDPSITYLNHPTVGATPLRVLAAQRSVRDEIERQPSRFMLRELTSVVVGRPTGATPRMRIAAQAVAAFAGARGDDVVFVDNATTGANAVLRSFPFEPGDEILVSDFGYGGIRQAATFAARDRQAVLRSVTLPWPHRADTIADAFEAAVGPRTRLAIVDHIAAQTSVVLPLAEIAARLKRRGVAVLGDGAHAPGAVPLDIPSLGVDWYVANLHKSAYVPRSSGILWAPPERQHGLHPPVISWGLDQGFAAEFDLVGTRDPSPHLTAPAALALIDEWGRDAVLRHNHDLAWNGAHFLADRWGTIFDLPEGLVATMATVMLPESCGATVEDAQALRDGLLFEDRIEVQVHPYRDRLYARVAAQVYNDHDDYERLAAAVMRRATGAMADDRKWPDEQISK
jgi:isopenicillin-N epimerase